jgi:hypothetical protein
MKMKQQREKREKLEKEKRQLLKEQFLVERSEILKK